jgi:hypothetical protein
LGIFPNRKRHHPSTVWAVIIGISDYQEKDIPDLRFSAATAT